MRTEKAVRLFNCHFQHVVDILSLILDRERVFLVATASAGLADHVHGRQEIHLYLLDTGSFTVLASTLLNIEGEAAGGKSPDLCVRGLPEEFPYVGEYSRVCRRIGTRAAPNGALVYFNYLVYVFQSLNPVKRQRLALEIVEM